MVPPPRVLRAVPSLTRAAIFYLGATVASACGTGATTDVPREEQIAQPYGAPPDPLPVPPPETDPPESEDPPDDPIEEPEAAVEPVEVAPTEGRRRRPADEEVVRIRRAQPNPPYGAPPLPDELA